MNKNEIRKEIAVLIDSIKEHSDEIGYKKRVPQLELELILSKIKKLYERSIVFNYLNSFEEGVSNESENKVENGGREDEPEIKLVQEEAFIETELSETIQPSPALFQSNPIKKSSSHGVKNPISDLKGAIGVNERLLYINQLFKGNADEFNGILNQLNNFSNDGEAKGFLESLKSKFTWKEDSPAYLSLLNLVERRYL